MENGSKSSATYFEQDEVLKGMSSLVAEKNAKFLVPIDSIWQPPKFLPNLEGSDWKDQLEEFRKQAEKLPDPLLVVLVGDTVTEEALPAYMSWLNRMGAIADKTGADQDPWPIWIRGWTAEEDRHKRGLDRFLYASGKVDMYWVDKTITYLIANGFNPGVGNPFEGFIFTSFQERATKISHSRAGEIGKEYGNTHLFKLCGAISGDERRHEQFYKEIIEVTFDQAPNLAMVAFRNMMKTGIVMPAALMDDTGQMPQNAVQSELFKKFSLVAQSANVYTARDYIGIFEHLINFWGIENRPVSGDGEKALADLMKMRRVFNHRLEGMMDKTIREAPAPTFSWIYDRAVPLTQEAASSPPN